jgi:hypothetical protein
MLKLRNRNREARYYEAGGYAREAGTKIRVASAETDNYDATRTDVNRCTIIEV